MIGRRTFAGVALAACSFAAVGQSRLHRADAEELRKIHVATSSASIPAGAARIANVLGLYEKHGLSATVTPMDTGSVATSGLLAGALDFVTSGPSDVVLAQANGQELVALTNGYRGFAASIVISKAAAQKAGIPPTAPIPERFKALDGLKIASTSCCPPTRQA
jgi:ABC-type nitrate/sulfonate/bicarbonate transport system substrate-binding protein